MAQWVAESITSAFSFGGMELGKLEFVLGVFELGFFLFFLSYLPEITLPIGGVDMDYYKPVGHIIRGNEKNTD